MGKPIETLSYPESGCMGVAMLAAVATGIYRDMDEAVSVCLQVQHRFVPREREQNDYAHKYAAYLRAYHALSYYYRSTG